jgi:hypothetical protein
MPLFEPIKNRGLKLELVSNPSEYSTIIGKGKDENIETNISIGHKSEKINSFYDYDFFGISVEENDARRGIKRVVECSMFPGGTSENQFLKCESKVYMQYSGEGPLRLVEENTSETEFSNFGGAILSSEFKKPFFQFHQARIVDYDYIYYMKIDYTKWYYDEFKCELVEGICRNKPIDFTQNTIRFEPDFMARYVPHIPLITVKPGCYGEYTNTSKYYCSANLIKTCFQDAYKKYCIDYDRHKKIEPEGIEQKKK